MNVRIGFWTGVWALLTTGACAQVIEEYQIKAAFIYNFAKFVEWPPQAFKTSTDPITICVLGQNPFGNALEQAVSGKTVEGRTFVVRQLSSELPATGCQILFVSHRNGSGCTEFWAKSRPPEC
jgi:hypothetical protein